MSALNEIETETLLELAGNWAWSQDDPAYAEMAHEKFVKYLYSLQKNPVVSSRKKGNSAPK